MSEYPELDGYEANKTSDISSKDLAARERELLGEDGAAELVGSAEAAAAETSNAESDTEFDGAAAPQQQDDDAYASFSASPQPSAPGAGPSAYTPQKVDLSESEFLKDWKIKRELELERRDKVSSEKRESTREKARKAVDDFYENYNSKKEKEAEKVHQEADAFAEKRDAEIGSGKGTTWDRIAQLMDGLGRPAEGVAASNKARFVDLVQSLKGDPNAPGAAGY